MSKVNVELVTPEKLVFSSEADLVVVPGSEGDFGVLHNHAPMISTLRPGVVKISGSDSDKNIFVSSGFIEVTGERCTILASDATDLATISQDEADKLILKATSEQNV